MTPPDLYGLIQASYVAQALYVLTKKKVFDALMLRPGSSLDLASRCQLHPRSLEQLLLLAASVGLVRREGDVFHLEEAASVLTLSARSWQRSYLLIWGEQLNPAFMHVDSWATRGDNPFELKHGAKIWEFYRHNQKGSERFVEFMDLVTEQAHIPAIVRALQVGDAGNIVDIAGGKGALACAVLAQYEQLQGVVFDQQHMQRMAEKRIQRAGLGERCKFMGGSMLESAPAGCDLYLIKHVLHDWPDRAALQILKNVRTAMGPRSRVIIIEGVLDRDCESAHLLHARNLEQMAWTDGKVRTLGELAALTRDARLQIQAVSHTEILDVSFVECVPMTDSS